MIYDTVPVGVIEVAVWLTILRTGGVLIFRTGEILDASSTSYVVETSLEHEILR